MTTKGEGGSTEDGEIRVFISASHADSAIAKRMAEILGANGVRATTCGDVAAGREASAQIRECIKQCDVFLQLITESSVNRPWVHQETGYAIALDIPIVPVAIGKLPDALMAQSHTIQVDRGNLDVLRERLTKEFFQRLRKADFGPPFEAYSGEQRYLFVSYSHKDSKTVYRELKRLHRLGFRIWYDEGIDPGNEWPEAIAAALAKCSYFVVFVSPQAVESANVRNEINFALNRAKPFLAIHIEETKLPTGLELRMGDIQAIFKWRMDSNRYERQVSKSLPDTLRDAVGGS